MKITLLLFVIMLVGCDAMQSVQGHVMDKQTGRPIDSVSIGKTEKEDPANSFTRRTYSAKDGEFHFNQVGGTNSVELYYSKPGYKTFKQYYPGVTDSVKVYLEKAN